MSGMARVLAVAGSDSGGGAGIQADIKTIACLGAYAATAVTALTAQNTRGVSGILAAPADFVAAQMRAVLEDIGADAIKTGMLVNGGIIHAVAGVLAHWPAIPVVVDPVMIAKGGAPLLADEAVAALKRLLIPICALVTPNIPEAEALTGFAVSTIDDMRRAAAALKQTGARAVLVKGGHLPRGDVIHNVLLADKETIFSVPRVASAHTHGTGCTLASAIATGLAQRLPLRESIERAQAFVAAGIAHAPGLGGGHGPLRHSPDNLPKNCAEFSPPSTHH